MNLVKPNSVLTQEALQNIILSNDTQKKVDHYELFCEGSRILSVSYNQHSAVFLVAKNLKVKKEDKKGIKNCVFFARGVQTIQGLSPFFKVDFKSFVSEFHSENKEENVISALTGNTPISVYLNEAQKLKTIQDLSTSSEILTLSDKIVLTSSERFLENKDKNNDVKLLKEKDVTGSPEDIKLRLSVFCSDLKTDLQKKENLQKYSEDLVAASHPLYINIIDLVPIELLSKNVNDSVYCTFIFKTTDRSYGLIQQTIKKTFFNQSDGKYGVPLLQRTDSGLNLVKPNSVLTQEALQNVILSNDTQKEVDHYELFCEGSRILSVSYNQHSAVFFSG